MSSSLSVYPQSKCGHALVTNSSYEHMIENGPTTWSEGETKLDRQKAMFDLAFVVELEIVPEKISMLVLSMIDLKDNVYIFVDIVYWDFQEEPQ